MAAKRKGMRTKALDDEIIAWVSSGQTLRAFCRQEGKPAQSAVYRWLEADEEFQGRFAHARLVGHDSIAAECVAIADEEPERTAHGTDNGYVSWQKNRIWTRLQLLAKWDPKRYGDSTKVTHEGGVTLEVITGVPAQEDG